MDKTKQLKKILVLTAPMGGGHIAAANAIGEAIERQYPGKYQVEVVDIFKEIKVIWTLDKLTVPIYTSSVKILNSYPYKIFYKFTDAYADQMNNFFATIFKDKFGDYLRASDPDIIISTFWAIGYAAQKIVGTKWHQKVPVVSVVTDAGDVHRVWLMSKESAVLVSTPETIDYAVAAGVPRNRLHYLGFPVDRRFADLPTKEEAREALKLQDKPTVLLSGGGLGLSNKLLDVAKHLAKEETGAQYLFVAGKNTKLVRALRELKFKDKVAVYGYVSNMPQLLAAADLVVGKAGWLSLNEAMVARRPTIIIDVIPGQEEPNAEFIERHGVGLVVRHPRLAAETIIDFTRYPAKLRQFDYGFDELQLDPKAGDRIAEFIVGKLSA